MKNEIKEWHVDGCNTVAVIQKENAVGWKHICTCDYGDNNNHIHLKTNQQNARAISMLPALLHDIEEIRALREAALTTEDLFPVLQKLRNLFQLVDRIYMDCPTLPNPS